MGPKGREWLAQSAYDLETAEFMFRGGRYFYCAFMCHLAVEKALKGIYHERREQPPPRTHNLVLLLNELQLRPPPEMGAFRVCPGVVWPEFGTGHSRERMIEKAGKGGRADGASLHFPAGSVVGRVVRGVRGHGAGCRAKVCEA